MMSEQQICPDRLGAWLNSWDTGSSSEAIFHYMTLGIKGGSTPHDPADLARCLRLLERFPEWKPRMHEMATVSDDWAILIRHWDRLEKSFIREAGGQLPASRADWSAPETYEEMQAIFYVKRDGFLFRRSMEKPA